MPKVNAAVKQDDASGNNREQAFKRSSGTSSWNASDDFFVVSDAGSYYKVCSHTSAYKQELYAGLDILYLRKVRATTATTTPPSHHPGDTAPTT